MSAMDTTRPPGIHIEQVFVDSVHFSHRNDATSLPSAESVDATFQLAWRSGGESGGEKAMCQLRFLTVDDEDGESPLYSVDVVMTMIVSRIRGQENMDTLEYVKQVGRAALTPYLREFVADLTRRGRFGAIDFPPINWSLAEPATDDEES